jgi:translation initiation factor IF-2
MRVYEVAKEFDVSSEALVHLLREMDIPVRSHMTLLGDEHVARLRTVLERERRLGHSTAEKAIGAALKDAQSGPRRRRRRVERSDEEPEAGDAEDADSTASPAADAAEAMAAEAAEAAVERGADLVTRGGEEPKDVTVVVEPAPPGEAAPAEEAPARPGPAAPVSEAPPRPAPPRPERRLVHPPPRPAGSGPRPE